MTRTTLTFLSILCLISAVVGGCNSDEASRSEQQETLPTATVSVAVVTSEVASNQIELVGSVEAVEQAKISAKITGNINSISVDLGSRVKKGELLVELHAGEISAQLQQASAQLDQAKRNLRREEKLLDQNAATPETVKALRDTVRIAQAAFLEAQTRLEYTKILAPFGGIITHKPAHVGDLATPGKPLLSIEGENNLQIITHIPEAMIHKIQKGDILHATIPAIDTQVSGPVTEISPTADSSSRTTPITIQIPSKANLRSGQFARVTLALAETETLAIPQSALLIYGQLKRVFVAKDNQAQLRLVRTGVVLPAADGIERIEVLSGLNENETVIISDNSNLQTGQPLKIR